MAFPEPGEGLVVSVEEVATRLGRAPADLTPGQRDRIELAIRDAQGVLEGELNRPLLPVEVTVTEQLPVLGLALTDWRAWPAITAAYDDRVVIVSTTAGVDGYYSVVVRVGIDARAVPDLRTWVARAATDDIRGDKDTIDGVVLGSRRVASVSSAGQSISYTDDGSTAGGGGQGSPAPGSFAALKRRWLRRGVYTRPDRDWTRPFYGT